MGPVAVTRADARGAIDDVMALSPLQQGLFSRATLVAAESGSEAAEADPYVIAMAADAAGPLDIALLRDCAAAMLTRHPNLRASFLHGNLSRPVQVIPSSAEVLWRHVRAHPSEVGALAAEERRRRFDVGRGPLIRFLLIELPDECWHLVIVAHHIVIDGWSLPLFVSELLALYRAGGHVAALPAAPRPYRDYIGWLAGRDQTASRAMWADHLNGLDGPTLLSPALADTPVQPGIPGRTEVRLDREATAELADAARTRGVTISTLVQMAWATTLSAFTGRGDVTFGVTVSGRPSELSGVETMIGLFINTVPLRVRLTPALPSAGNALSYNVNSPCCATTAISVSTSFVPSPVSVRCSTPYWCMRTSARRGGGHRGVRRKRGDVPSGGAREFVALSGDRRRAPQHR